MILITGVTGMVGTHIAYALACRGQKVRALKRAGSSISETEKIFRHYAEDADVLLDRIEWVEGDVLDIFSLDEALKDVTEVYHAAAMVSFIPAERNQMMKTNIEGTANMINCAMNAGVKKFCHVSSVAALGKTLDMENINEDVWWKNDPSNSWYAISKYSAEREVWRAGEEGMNVVIVNPSVIVGPGNPARSSNAIFALAKKGFSWYTAGSGGFVDARDVAEASVQLMESDIVNERFVLNAVNMNYRSFADRILASFKHKPVHIELGPIRLGLLWRTEKILAAISGRKPRITKETAASACEVVSFNGNKITEKTGFRYRDFNTTLAETARYYT